MNYWLMKSEPDVFGIEHLKKLPNKTDHWDGVRNYQARNMMREPFQLRRAGHCWHYESGARGLSRPHSV